MPGLIFVERGFALVDSTGTILGQAGIVASAIRTGVGFYKLTLIETIASNERSVIITPRGAVPLFTAYNFGGGLTFDVAFQNAAGAATDADFEIRFAQLLNG